MATVPPAFSPCPNVIGCPGTDYPISNFSSEAPDVLIFYGLQWPGGGGQGVAGGDPGTNPPPNSNWTSQGCFGIVSSTISQADADLQASAAALTCQPGQTVITQITSGPSAGLWMATGCFGICYGNSFASAQALANTLSANCPSDPTYSPPTQNGQPIPVYTNHSETCTVFCPDGSTYSYTLRAGMISGPSQAYCDAAAQSTACNAANALKFWVGVNPTDSNPLHINDTTSKLSCCMNTSFNREQFVKIKGSIGPFNITADGLPPGLSFEQVGDSEGVINETATTPGTYTIGVNVFRPSDRTHNHRNFTMSVMGLTDNATLPQAVASQFYQFAFNVTGGSPDYNFTADSRFPIWLTLYPTGLVQGTPGYGDIGTTKTFTITCTDANGVQCSKDFTLNVVATVKITFNMPVGGTQCSAYSGTVTISPVGSATINSSSISGLPDGVTAVKTTSSGVVTYTCSGTCWSPRNYTVSVSGTDNFGYTANGSQAVNISSIGLVYATAAQDINWILQIESINGTASPTMTANGNSVTIQVTSNSPGVLAGAVLRAYGYLGRCGFHTSYALTGASVTSQSGGRINSTTVNLQTQACPVTIAACAWSDVPPINNNTTMVRLDCDNFNGVGFDAPCNISITFTITPSVPTNLVAC